MHVGDKALPEDEESIEKIAQYIVRAPLAQDKMTLSPDGRTVIYRSHMRPGLKRNFEVFDVLDWLAAITSHIPDKGQNCNREPPPKPGSSSLSSLARSPPRTPAFS